MFHGHLSRTCSAKALVIWLLSLFEGEVGDKSEGFSRQKKLIE